MRWWNGISQCWRLSEHCHVWWEAWGVVVGTCVGALSAYIAWLAWQTSNRATHIADQARLIASQQKEEADRVRNSQRRILEQMLYEEVLGLGIWVQQTYSAFDHGIDLSVPSGVRNPRSLHFALRRCQDDWLVVTRSLRDELHLLEHGHGEVLSQLIGTSIAIKEMATRILNSWSYDPTDDEAGTQPFVFYGRDELMVLRMRLRKLSTTTWVLSGRFAETVEFVDLGK